MTPEAANAIRTIGCLITLAGIALVVRACLVSTLIGG